MTRSYLDWNATSPLRPEAAAAVVEALRLALGNPSSAHAEGQQARRLIERARGEVAALLGSSERDIVFTSGGTEANAAALWGRLAAGHGQERRSLLLSAVEHPAVSAMADELARLGVAVERLPVSRSGLLGHAALEESLGRHHGALVAVQLANSETGVLQDLEAVCRLAHAADGSVHCDAVQAAGKVPLAPAAWGVDTLAVSGHKLGSPPGVGALFVRDGLTLAPLIPGTQEEHRRGGTENGPGIAGMGAACAAASRELPRWQGLAALRDAFEDALTRGLPGAFVLGADAPRLPNTSCVCLPQGLNGGVAVAALDLEGFAVSSGPACSTGVERRSTTAEAMGLDADAAGRTLRVSLGPGTGEGEVLGLVAALERIWRRGKEGVR
jgi:cysteine desulfurase